MGIVPELQNCSFYGKGEERQGVQVNVNERLALIF